ncbi:MAG: energy-coupling factor transporter transmembrane protein EcfT [Clostridiales bacterium]|nr:energy-coupling factor transporter transmembrane protein EcfT [Candidatus Crickella merdequi]
MKSISLYKDKGTWLNLMHPYTKLLYIVAAISIPLIGGKLWLFGVLIAASLVLLASGKVLRSAVPLVAFSATLIIVIFLIQGLFNHANAEALFSVGPLTFYKEGVLFACRLGLNILNMLLSFAVFVLTTSPQELVDEMEKNGFSPKFGYIINSVFQILPQMMMTKDTITDAQRSRGLETEGSLGVRMKAFIPLISPVVMSSLVNTRERAIALEVRGFGRKNKKTWLEDRPKHKGDRVIGVILVLLVVLTIAGRVLGWL